MLIDERYLGRFWWPLSCSVNDGDLYPNLMSGELPGLGEVTAKHKHTLFSSTTIRSLLHDTSTQVNLTSYAHQNGK